MSSTRQKWQESGTQLGDKEDIAVERLWQEWIDCFGNRQYLDGLDATCTLTVSKLSQRKGIKSTRLLIISLGRAIISIVYPAFLRKPNKEYSTFDILFVSHKDAINCWQAMVPLIECFQSKYPKMRIAALIPSYLDCPESIPRINLEEVENAMQKRVVRWNIRALKAFVKHSIALITKTRKHQILYKRIKRDLSLVLKNLITVCFQVQLGRKLLRQIKPKCVVVSVDFSSPVSCSALLEGIPVFMLQHGLVDPYNVPFLSDILYIWGDFTQDKLISYGAKPESLVKAGSLAFKALENKLKSGQTDDTDTNLKPLIDLKGKGFSIFVLWSQGELLSRGGELSNQYRTTVDWFIEAKDKLDKKNEPKYCFVIKLHPTERTSDYYCAIWNKEQLDDIYFLDGKTPSAQLLKICDVAATFNSGAGYDTMMAGVPLIQLYSPDWPEIVSWWRFGVTRCSSADDICQSLTELINPEKRTEILKNQEKVLDMAFTNRGREAEAIAEDIMQRIFKSNQL